MPQKRKNAIKVNHVKLKGEWGHAKDGQIYLDNACIGFKRLEILTHEILHILDWNKEEAEVVRESKVIARTLWKQGYRFADLQNLQSLQHEKNI